MVCMTNLSDRTHYRGAYTALKYAKVKYILTLFMFKTMLFSLSDNVKQIHRIIQYIGGVVKVAAL